MAPGLIAGEKSRFTVQWGGFPLTHEQASQTVWMNVIPCFSSEGDSCEFGSQKYFLLCGFGGILSCGTTHTAVVPLDLVKCRLQVRVCVLAGVTWVCLCELTPVQPLISMLSVVLWCMSMCVCSLTSQSQAIAASSAQGNTTPSAGSGASWAVVLRTRPSCPSTWSSAVSRSVLPSLPFISEMTSVAKGH